MKFKIGSTLTKCLIGLMFSFCALGVNAQSYEDEVRELLAKQTEGWNNADIANISSDSFSIGFGFRSFMPRSNTGRTPEADRAILQFFLNSLESYKIIPGEITIVIDGEIALVSGFHVEEIKHKGQSS